MPSGPSHSHSSGGHSSGGGGFSGGRSSFGGFYGGGMRHRHPIHMHFFGRTVIVSGARQVLMSVLSMFFIMACFFAFGMGLASSGNKSDAKENSIYLNLMQEDNVYYNNMINSAKAEDAEENGYYIATATFPTNIRYEYYSNDTTGIYYYGDYGDVKIFYIVYEYENSHYVNEITGEIETEIFIGETYAQFTKSQLRGLGGKINIAYTYDQSECGWISINLDYPTEIYELKEYKMLYLETEGLLSSAKFLNTATIVSIVVAVALVVGLILNIVFAAKKSKKEAELEEQKTKAEIKEKEAKIDMIEEELKKKNRVCAYCGCTVPDGANKCPVCGASKYKKKK